MLEQDDCSGVWQFVICQLPARLLTFPLLEVCSPSSLLFRSYSWKYTFLTIPANPFATSNTPISYSFPQAPAMVLNFVS